MIRTSAIYKGNGRAGPFPSEIEVNVGFSECVSPASDTRCLYSGTAFFGKQEAGSAKATEDYRLGALGEAADSLEPARSSEPLRRKLPAGSLPSQLTDRKSVV